MAEFTHEEQVEIVRRAFSLETAIMVEGANVDLIKSQKFDRFPAYADVFSETPPSKPQRQVLPPPAPIEAVLPEPPKTAYSAIDHLKAKPYWAVALAALFILALIGDHLLFYSISYDLDRMVDTLSLICKLAFPVCLIAFFVSVSQEKKRKNQELANSPEYLQSVASAQRRAADERAQADLRTQTEQAQLDAQYEAELERYNSVLLPSYEKARKDNEAEYAEMRIEYEQDKAEWDEKRLEAIAALEDDITANKAALAELYDTTGIISMHYREIPILEWLYDDMRSSDHDIRYATELLDRDRQRIATIEAGARTTDAIDRLRDEVHRDVGKVMMLQGVQIQGLRNLEAVSEDILYTTEDIYTSSKKILFHQRVNTVDVGLREWRRHKAKKAAKRS